MNAALPWSLGAVLGASLIGSLHCVGMCGPLATLAMRGSSPRDSGKPWDIAIGHSLGRLLVYLAIGAAAGALGYSLNLVGRLADVAEIAWLIAGAGLLAGAAVSLAIWRGWLKPLSSRRFSRALVPLQRMRPRRRAWALGMLSGLLPCGWLWSFAVIAAGSGNIASGALIMAAFWAGTAPAMFGVLTIAAPLVRRLQRHMPVLTIAVMLVLGAGALWLRKPLVDAMHRSTASPAATQAGSGTTAEVPSCH